MGSAGSQEVHIGLELVSHVTGEVTGLWGAVVTDEPLQCRQNRDDTCCGTFHHTILEAGMEIQTHVKNYKYQCLSAAFLFFMITSVEPISKLNVFHPNIITHK